MHKFAIILILAAILVPSMIGYVHKAKEAQASYEDDYSTYYDEDYDYSFDE